MSYPEAVFCSAEHGYFDRNKHIKCPKCVEENVKERIKENKNSLRAKLKELQAENERLKAREEQWQSLLKQSSEIIEGWKSVCKDLKDMPTH